MIRVLRVIARMNVGGPAIHAELLTRRLDPERYRTVLVTGTEGDTEGNHLELHAQHLPDLVTIPDLGREIRGLQDLRSLRALRRVIRQFRPHVVHTHAAKAGTIGRLAAALARVPVVVHTFHGHVLRGYFSAGKEQVYRSIERGLAMVTDELVAVSPKVREELLEMGIGRPNAFSVVPLGFDLAPFECAAACRGHVRTEFNIPASAPTVGIVARLVPIKAHELFFAAAEALHRIRPDMHFLVVGDGERRDELEQLVSARGLREVTHFLGWRADLARIYADLDVVLLTSRNEGSPVALIEAMACARPVISTRVGGVPDVVSHGETGWLVEAGDVADLVQRVIDVITQPDLSERIAVAGREKVFATYGAERLLADVDALYTRLLAREGLVP